MLTRLDRDVRYNLADIELYSNVYKSFQIVSIRIHGVDTLQDPLVVVKSTIRLVMCELSESLFLRITGER